MSWTKLTPSKGSGARPQIATPRVRRSPSAPHAATLSLPGGGEFRPEQKFSVYSDGNGRIAFRFGDTGEYRTHKNRAGQKAVHCSIPSQFAGRLPFGTTEVALTKDGEMHVLDFSQLDAG